MKHGQESLAHGRVYPVTFPALINFLWVEFGKRLGNRGETPLKHFTISGYDDMEAQMPRAKK
jgi:hypothetical protein